MQCQRCNKDEGEYLCSVCNRVVCENCKLIDNGKVYCLDHSPRKDIAQEPKPKKNKLLKELIAADFILLIGVSVIFFISNTLISNMVMFNFDLIKQNFPQLTFVFTLLAYFTSIGVYSIIFLIIILITLVATLIYKKHKDKNI
ncbi:hypothetical protein A3K64_02005 [Candidatus Micrarchaeota archaeon RBG_16_36_9]|nr:MAG: hypothetical protein A3K64_02005 [Candidatus Micrarchaeota archaeon RBG_16_36_9]